MLLSAAKGEFYSGVFLFPAIRCLYSIPTEQRITPIPVERITSQGLHWHIDSAFIFFSTAAGSAGTLISCFCPIFFCSSSIDILCRNAAIIKTIPIPNKSSQFRFFTKKFLYFPVLSGLLFHEKKKTHFEVCHLYALHSAITYTDRSVPYTGYGHTD